MWGGHGDRKFYLDEVDRIESARIAQLPKSNYTDAQIQAGFERIQRTFGFYSTLLYMENSTSYKRDELLMWTVAEFYTNFAYLAWTSHALEKYHQILKDSKKDK